MRSRNTLSVVMAPHVGRDGMLLYHLKKEEKKKDMTKEELDVTHSQRNGALDEHGDGNVD